MILVRSIMHFSAGFANRYCSSSNSSKNQFRLAQPNPNLARRVSCLEPNAGTRCCDTTVVLAWTFRCQSARLQNAAVVFSAHNFFLDILTLKVAGGKAENEFHVELLKGHLAHILHLGNLQSQQQHVQHVSARIKRIGAYSLPSSQTHGPQNIAVPWAPSHTAF